MTLLPHSRSQRALIGLLVLVALPQIAAAQLSINTPSSVSRFSSLSEIIPRMFNIAVGVSGIIFVVLLLLGGVQYLVSFGQEEAVTKARKLMLNAFIGLVIVITSWGIGNYVLQLLGVRVTLTGGELGIPAPVGGGAANPGPSTGGTESTGPTETAPNSTSTTPSSTNAQINAGSGQEVPTPSVNPGSQEILKTQTLPIDTSQ